MTAAPCPSFCNKACPALLSALFALALYAVTLGGDFVYDDVQIVVHDPRVSDPHLWGQFWTHDYWNVSPAVSVDKLYRPLTSLSYGVQWWMSGSRGWPFHLVNILLHVGAAAAVAELGRRLGGMSVGLIAGLLFAAHPVHVEAVAGIVGRAELACTLTALLAVILFLHRPMTIGRALVIWVLCAVSMLFKEQGMLMPAILLAAVMVRGKCFTKETTPSPGTPGEGEIRQPSEKKAMQWLVLLLAWTVSAYIVIREQFLKLKFEWDRSFLDWTLQPLIRSHGLDRALSPVVLVGHYMRLLVFPTRLSLDYGVAVLGSKVSPADPYLWLGAVTILGLVIGSIALTRRRNWGALFCIFAAAITYSMVANVIIIGVILAERLIYFPSAFLLILAAVGLSRLPGRVRLPLVILIVMLFCLRTFTYARIWNDRDTLYRYALLQQPNSSKLRLLVADRDRSENRLDEAREILRVDQALVPDDPGVWKMSGLVEESAGNWQAAADDYQRAFELQPAGNVLGKAQEMREMLRKQQAATRK